MVLRIIMWLYLGVITASVSFIYFLYQKCQIQSFLQKREKNLTLSASKGEEYRFKLTAATDKAPAHGYLEIDCHTSLQFLAKHETSKEKWAKALGLSYECQTGAAVFDDDIYLASITQDDAEVLGNNNDVKKLIYTLLKDLSSSEFASKNFYKKNEINCDGKSLYLKVVFRTTKELSELEQLRKKLSTLRLLAARLASYKPETRHFWKVPAQRNTAIILALSTALMVIGSMEFFRFIFLSDNQLFHPFSFVPITLLLSSTGLVFLIFYVLTFVKKSARRHWVLFEVCLSGFFGLIFTIYGFIYDINTELDRSKPQIVNYKVLEKYTERHRTRRSSYNTYHLLLENVSEPVSASIKINNGLYSQLSKDDFVEITIRNGFFNQPWRETIKKCVYCDNTF